MPIHELTDYLSIFVGFQLYLYFNRSSFFVGVQRYWYVIGALVGALVGSRLLALLSEPYLFSNLSTAVVLGNKTIMGAILGGIIGIEIIKKFIGIKQRTGDSAVIPLMIAIMIGRIGCQLTGVSDGTIGIPCDFLWCFQQGDTYNRHPLPLYEILTLLAFLPFVYQAYKKKLFEEGTLFRFFVIGYFGFRFFIEFLKDEPQILFSLTVIQLVCLAVCAFYLYDVRRELFSIARKRKA
jgi:phosphatidylglycerol:prolipoprotein diacylglycerol transferase